LKRKYYKSAVLIFILILLFFLSGCSNNQSDINTSESSAFMMNTLVKMRAHGENAQKAVSESMNRVREIEDLMSKTIETSDIYKLNNSSGDKIDIALDTKLVLEKALYYSELTEGKFDPTIGVLVDLWGIGTDDPYLPSQTEIENALQYVDYNKLDLHENSAEVENGVKIDLGGIAKGYAADEVKKTAEEFGVESAFVNLGGNVLVIGKKPDGSSWRVGIQDPRRGRGNVMAVIEAEDKTIVTSGNYERFFEKDDKIYHHILNPDTGYPAENGLLSVSIISEDSFDADALSTSIYILGLEKGLKFIESQENTEVMFITDKLDVYLSSGIKDKIQITDDNFNIIEGENFANR